MRILHLALISLAWLTFAGAVVACGDDQGNAPTATIPGGTRPRTRPHFLPSLNCWTAASVRRRLPVDGADGDRARCV